MANDREALAVNIRRSRLFFMAGGVQVKANLVPKSGLPLQRGVAEIKLDVTFSGLSPLKA